MNYSRIEPAGSRTCAEKGVSVRNFIHKLEIKQEFEHNLLVLDLGSEVETNITELTDGVLGGEGNVARHREGNGDGERGGLGEGNELSQGDRQGDFLIEIDGGALAPLIRGNKGLQ